MTAGLRRLRATAPPVVARSSVAAESAAGTRTADPGAATPADRCEMCAVPIPAEHDHLVDVEERGLPCVCRPCWLLFTAPGAAGGRYAAVPPGYVALPGAPLTERGWSRLDVPVRLVFVFRHSGLDRAVAFYPSPAGAAESPLPAAVWQEVLDRHPATAALPQDVNAVLLHHGQAGVEGFIVPIDACYRLVGLVRQHWRGFDGGADAWHAIDGFLDDVRARSTPAEVPR